MNLLVDIGNQNLKWSFGTRSGQFPSDHATVQRNFERQWKPLKDVAAVVFVNVAGEYIRESLCAWTSMVWHISPQQVVPKSEQCGVINGYRNVDELGADRWAALIGARSITQESVVIVDCGTAVTVDALSTDGIFVGGSILPGFHLSQRALWGHTKGIGEFPKIELSLPARSTAEAVSSGIVYGIAGGIDRVIDRYRPIVGEDSRIILTGGDASLLNEHSRHSIELVPNLVLQGLSLIAESELIQE